MGNEIVSTRVFSVPRELMWKAWTDPEHLVHWWGPKGFTNTFQVFDLRPGGDWKFVMYGPNGTDFANHCVFAEIAAPERLVFDHLEPVHAFRVTAEFDDLNGKTRVRFRMRFVTESECERVRVYVVPSNEENFDRLGAHLMRMESGR